MRILAIETATPVASCAVIDAGGVLAETIMRRHVIGFEGEIRKALVER